MSADSLAPQRRGDYACSMQSISHIAVDWGTTSLRLWALTRDGAVVGRWSKQAGMAALEPADYPTVLEEGLAVVRAPPDAPVIVCGMAGARQGWIEAPYIETPAAFSDIPAHAVAAPGVARDVRILPGAAQRDRSAPDVMRGEETLLMGAGVADGLVCLPGTHAKWAVIEAGMLERFQTVMTGEIFALLSEQSTLKHFTSGALAGDEQAAFRDGVAEGFARPEQALAGLFKFRAGPLLFDDMAPGARSQLSGMLIGAELGLCAGGAETVTLLAAGPLAELYAEALRAAGKIVFRQDAEVAAIQGLHRAAAAIWSETL